ncbi:MAG: hypothetical protein JSW43_13175 [Gemmatimonadota bacterium]|nr:MAG: hypothetical protein JSW43_13175 [Gemmatimonadota bacterium]
MTEHDRREFLKKLAKTAAYAAPVVYSLAAPIELGGVQMASKKPPMGMTAGATQSAPGGAQQPGGQAPWERPPPGGNVP